MGHSFQFLQLLWPHQYRCTCQRCVLRPFSGGGPPRAQHQRPGTQPARLHFVLCRWQRSASLGSAEVTPDMFPTLGSAVWLCGCWPPCESVSGSGLLYGCWPPCGSVSIQSAVWLLASSMWECHDLVCCMATGLLHVGVSGSGLLYGYWPPSCGSVRIWSAVWLLSSALW